jgi:hypothetical protein
VIAMSTLKNFPVGIADFREIHDDNYIYVDKTALLYKLTKTKRPYFLSRPRRFGKTLLVSTLEALLRGQRELFKGLWIHNQKNYDWTPKPIIHLSLNSVDTSNIDELKDGLKNNLEDTAKRENLTLSSDNPTYAFKSLMVDMYYKHGERKVPVLIDEYDAPTVSKLSNPINVEEIWFYRSGGLVGRFGHPLKLL